MAAGRVVRRGAVSATVSYEPCRDYPLSPEWRGGDFLTVTLSVLFILAGVVFVLVRYAGLRILHALFCILLGFYLASSSLAPDIGRTVSDLIRALTG